MITLLPWDTEFFGVPIGTTTCPEIANGAMACVYYLADTSAQVRDAEDHGFRTMDTRVTLHANDSRVDAEGLVRDIVPDDIEPLVALARSAHTTTRFWNDPRFASRAPDLYETWFQQDCAHHTVRVIDHEGNPAGYITDDEECISLIAVHPDCQGKGYGKMLVRDVLRRLGTVDVVTQADNAPAMGLYQSCGFTVARVQYWMHRWQ